MGYPRSSVAQIGPAQGTRPRLALSVHQESKPPEPSFASLTRTPGTALLAPRGRSRLTPHSSPDSARPRRITLPSATARPGAAFMPRPGAGQGCGCGPGGLKGRGRLREPRSTKHRSAARSAGGPRDRSTSRAFWLLLSSFLPVPNQQNHPFHRHTYPPAGEDRTPRWNHVPIIHA